MSGSLGETTDRNQIATALRPLITAELIAEHRRDPLGHHSDALKRVLNYIRRTDPNGTLAVVCIEPFKRWRIARISEIRGQRPTFTDERIFTSEADAMHAVFLMRIDEIMHD
jgi:branched-chain amino acid transport system permease protein